MTRQQVPFLRVVVGVLALVALLTQVLVVPRVAAGYAAAYPQVEYLARPYTIAVVIAILGFEGALLAAWQMLSAVKAGEVPMRLARRWATVMAGSLWFMALVLAGVCVHAGFVENVGGPPTLFGLLVSLAVLPAALVLRNRVMSLSVNGMDDRMALGHPR